MTGILKKIRNIFWLTLILLLSEKLLATPLHDFIKANQYYTKAQYDSAIAVYEFILNQGYESAQLYYNLGNAYFKMKNIPKAILNYERARLLSPQDDEINFNLQLAQNLVVDKITPLPELFLKKWWKNLKHFFSSNTWAIISLVSFGCMLIFFTLYLFTIPGIIKKISFILIILMFLISIVAFSSAHSIKSERTTHNTAIVMSSTVTVKSSPDENGTDLFVIHEGTKVWVLDQLGDWLRIKIADGNNGWLKTSDVERI